MLGLEESDEENERKERGCSSNLSTSLVQSSTDTNLKDEGMRNTSLSTPTFFSNIALEKKSVKKVISKSTELKTPR